MGVLCLVSLLTEEAGYSGVALHDDFRLRHGAHKVYMTPYSQHQVPVTQSSTHKYIM